MVEGHITLGIYNVGSLMTLVFQFFCLQELKNTIGSGCGGLQVGHALGNGCQRAGEKAGIHDKGYDDTKGNHIVHCQHSTDYTDGHIAHIAYSTHNGLHDTGEELGFPVCVV